MENLLTFTGYVMIAFGILQIILFFKMWGMTNNVKEIKKRYFDELEARKQEKEALQVSQCVTTEPYIEKKDVLKNPIAEPVNITKSDNVQVPTRELKHYDIAEKDINKLKVLKKRGFIEQAVNEFIKISSADKEDAIIFINSL